MSEYKPISFLELDFVRSEKFSEVIDCPTTCQGKARPILVSLFQKQFIDQPGYQSVSHKTWIPYGNLIDDFRILGLIADDVGHRGQAHADGVFTGGHLFAQWEMT